MNKSTDTIIALASPYGKSAIAVIRISGKRSVEIVNRYLSRALSPNKIQLCTFKTKNFSEQLMASAFIAPHSYTGENEVELYPHGNMTICDKIIKTLIDDGMRAAEKGEFTMRAYTNNKINLMQCEALADIIDGESEEQLLYANSRYNGEYNAVDKVKKMLVDGLSTVEATLHYGDELEKEDVDDKIFSDVYDMIDKAIDVLQTEIYGYDGGKIINEGFKVALVGVPNVGKSTLLNALLNSDRAIVTDIAGTTRDTIDGGYIFGGKKFIVTDTAGITETSDKIEKIGIERSKKAIENADAVVLVTVGEKNDEILRLIGQKPCIIAINKQDDLKEGEGIVESAKNPITIKISAKRNKNVTALKRLLDGLTPKNVSGICNHRQYDCVVNALDRLKQAKIESKKAQNLEIVAAVLYEAYSFIAKLYGESDVDEKVISEVFNRFCVGK